MNKRFFPFLMWFLPLSFFAFQFILRLWPSLLMHQIMERFAIDASSFGLLASIYYYGYAGMQIPIAIALDRFKPRFVIFTCVFVCSAASLIFTYTDHWYVALGSRFLIGAGSAIGFLGTSKVVSQWFSKDQYSRMIGFTFTFGLMGAIYGGKPINLFVEQFGGFNVAISLAIVGLLIALSVGLFLRSPKTQESSLKQDPLQLSDFKKLMTSPVMWVLALANLLMVGTLEGFADVWGVNYLVSAYDMSKSEAAKLSSFIFVGMLFGGPLLAFFTRKFSHFSVICFCGILTAGVFFLFMFAEPSLPEYLLTALFLCLGIMCCYQVLIFSAGSDLVEPKLLGVTVAFFNCINMLGGSFFHTLIGLMMDIFWTGETRDGLRHYTLESYNHALLTIPVCSLIGACMVVWVGWKLRRQALQVSETSGGQ